MDKTRCPNYLWVMFSLYVAIHVPNHLGPRSELKDIHGSLFGYPQVSSSPLLLCIFSGENIIWAQRFPFLTQKRKQEYGWCNDHLDIADWGCRAANCKKCHQRWRGSNQKANNCLLSPEKKDMDPEQRSVLAIIDIIANTVYWSRPSHWLHL